MRTRTCSLLAQNVWDFAANRNTDSSKHWNVPLGAGVGKLQKLGKLPLDFKLVYYNYVVRPTFGPEWSALLGVKFILPR